MHVALVWGKSDAEGCMRLVECGAEGCMRQTERRSKWSLLLSERHHKFKSIQGCHLSHFVSIFAVSLRAAGFFSRWTVGTCKDACKKKKKTLMCPDLRLVRARGCVQNELIDDLTSSFVRVPFVGS